MVTLPVLDAQGHGEVAAHGTDGRLALTVFAIPGRSRAARCWRCWAMSLFLGLKSCYPVRFTLGLEGGGAAIAFMPRP